MTELISITQAFEIKDLLLELDPEETQLEVAVIDISEIGLSEIFSMYPLHDYDNLFDSILKNTVSDPGYSLDELRSYLDEADIMEDEEIEAFLKLIQVWCEENHINLQLLLPNMINTDENFEYIGCVMKPDNLSQVIVLYTCSVGK